MPGSWFGSSHSRCRAFLHQARPLVGRPDCRTLEVVVWQVNSECHPWVPGHQAGRHAGASPTQSLPDQNSEVRLFQGFDFIFLII